MLLDICLGTRTVWKILFVLNEAPGKNISKKEIRGITKLGNKNLSKFLLMLEKFDVVTKTNLGRTSFYKLNLNSPFVEELLNIIKAEKKSLNNLDTYILNTLREFVYETTNVCLSNISKIILFGSCVKRTYSPSSDIDIALIFKEKNLEEELLITEIIEKIKVRFGKSIQPHFYTQKEFESSKRKDRLIGEIVKDGINLIP